MKLLYKPFQIITRVLSHRVGKETFHGVWSHFSDLDQPPAPTAGHMPLTRVAGTAALEAATLAAFTAIGEQLTARLFHHLFGTWPAKPGDSAEDSEAVSATRAADTA
jgi:hypothetical protein